MKFLSLVLLCCALSANLYAGQLYKWVDADGNVQFSQTPPPEPAARENVTQGTLPQADANTIPTRPVGEDTAEDDADAAEEATDTNADLNSDDPAVRMKAQKAENCRRAKDQYARLGTDEKLLTEQDGQYVEVTGEARDAKRSQAKAYIDNFCQDGAAN